MLLNIAVLVNRLGALALRGPPRALRGHRADPCARGGRQAHGAAAGAGSNEKICLTKY